jgi:hypothetical protein
VVIAGAKREWSSRLAHLTGLVEAGARGPAWLWRIRIRILRYLLARYGEPGEAAAPELEAGRRDAGDTAFPGPAEPPPPVVIGTLRPPVGVEHPPKPGAVITPILKDIHDVNVDLRIARWQDPPPDQVWTWWRSQWCGRT